MKKIKALGLSLIILLSFGQASFSAPESIGSFTRTIKVNNVNKTVNVVTVDLNSQDIEIGVAVANDKVSGSEDFGNMIKRKNAVAAINGNFFDAYKTLEPMGTIMINKEMVYLEGTNTSMVISDKRKVDMDNFKITVKGYLDGMKENKWNNATGAMDFNVFDIWYKNNLPNDSSGVYLYTSARGDKILLKEGTSIEVIENKITKVVKNPGEQIIPKNGYLIYYGKDAAPDSYINQRFKIGRTVSLENQAVMSSQTKVEVTKVMEVNKATETLSAKQTKLFGSINKKTKNNWVEAKKSMEYNLFNIWYINTKPIDSSGAYLYTPERGDFIELSSGYAITVNNGIVSKVDLNPKKVDIPKIGFVIYYGKDAAKTDYIQQRFKVGNSVDFYHEKTLALDTQNIMKKAVENNMAALSDGKLSSNSTSSTQTKEESIISKAEGIISAGPYLVEGGKVIVDSTKEGFKEDKITTDRAQRSGIGMTKDNKLIMVTGSNLNMDELAKVMVELGAVKAMNLDGGASSGLYAKGQMITKPGRKLNTVLMVYDKSIK